ncbi:MAG: methyltransferase domain-containing protein [Bacteroidales bacterium]|nr:methyltransferase domain-containing protein [Bacteroidales bacterium]
MDNNNFSLRNKKLYESEQIVNSYVQYQSLDKPEETIIRMFYDQWKEMSLLDIGIGVGRTTGHFAPLVREYTGVDYSEQMIRKCRERFASFPQYIFKVLDMRNLDGITDASMDFVLCDFNSLDYIPLEGRIMSLKEVWRVLKPGGNFLFSSHNILGLKDQYVFKSELSMKKKLVNPIKYLSIRLVNKSFAKIDQSDHQFILDGSHRFRTKTFYIKTQTQINQLRAAGFEVISVYSIFTGEPLTEAEYTTLHDPWFYYFCRKKLLN